MKPLNALVFSDVHVMHRLINTVNLLNSLYSMIDTKFNRTHVNVIFIAGDFFDRLCDLPRYTHSNLTLFIGKLLQWCEKHNVKLRVLEGTPLHDNKQSKIFSELHESFGSKCDLRFITEIEIEYISEYDCNVLYIPDEASDNALLTQQKVESLLEARNITQVDIGIMHGFFKFQTPFDKEHPKSHDEDYYLTHIKHYIFNGHDHTHKVFRRIIVQGSFDRLAHNQEESKGLVYASMGSEDHDDSYFFVENTKATIFKTIDFSNLDHDQSVKLFRKEVDKLPPESHVRLQLNKDSSFTQAVPDLIRMYPLLEFIKDWVKKDKIQASNQSVFTRHIPITITKQNIHPRLIERLQTSGVEASIVERSSELLKEVIDE